jgi:BMFP domain-containing protein YqiC
MGGGKAMTETERDADHIRRALNTLLILCGDDGADDADRVMLALAHDGLESLLNRIANLEARSSG